MPSPVTTPSTPAAPGACAGPGPRGAAAARWPTARPHGRPPAPPAGPPCRPVRRRGPASARSRPVERRRGQGERDQLRPLVLHARPALRHGRDGTRVAGGQVHAVRRPARRLARQLLAGRAPGTGHQGHAGRLVVGDQQRLDLARPRRPRRAPPPPSAGGRARSPGSRRGRRPRPARPGPTQPSRSCSETRRSTALANPAAPGPTSERTSATVVEIAACAGTRMASSWWVPSRSASSTRACTFASGRSMQAASTASYRPWRRIVPDASSVANAASRPAQPVPLQGRGQGEVRVGVRRTDGAEHLQRSGPGRVSQGVPSPASSGPWSPRRR